MIGADASVYREHHPPAELAGHIAGLWDRYAPPSVPATVRVVPDGCADIIWQHADGAVSTFVAGPDSRVQYTELTPGARMAGVRFAPGVAASVLGVPLVEVRDQRVPLGELWGAVADELAEQAATAGHPLLVLAAAVRRRIVDRPDAVTGAIVRALGQAHGPGVIARLAVQLGLSERQLHRRCLISFGYGPKTLQRVLRFQRALQLTRAGGRPATVAAVTGYADQAHLAREVRRLAGVPLTELVSRPPARRRRAPAGRA